MALKIAAPVTVEASVATGAAVDISKATTVSAFLTGTFVGTVQWQISADGTNFLDTGAAQTAPGIVTITTPANWLRADTTAYTSGTPVGVFVVQE